MPTTNLIYLMSSTPGNRILISKNDPIVNQQTSDGAHEQITIGSITIDPAQHHVTVDGKAVRLTSVEFKLLATLMRRRGEVQERDRLLQEVWAYENVINTRTVDTHVRRLRKKLGQAADAIQTVRGFGYCIR
jgi:DNA-binding response OmpR family regulator